MSGKPKTAQSSPQPPRLPARMPTSYTRTSPPPEGQGSYENTALSDYTFDELHGEDFQLTKVLCKRVSLNQASLSYAHVEDSRLDSCDLAGSTWEHAQWLRVELLGCRMVGMQLSGASLQDVQLTKCNATAAQLWASSFKAVVFDQCNLQDASFTQANLSGATFRNCDLSGANFLEAKLVGADFRGSNLSGVRIALHNLAGAILDPSQILPLASALGIIIKDIHEP
jgi:uncharacterized protein YjbI with pentapeptide repeats